MAFFDFLRRHDTIPAKAPFEMLPSLCVCVFGPVERLECSLPVRKALYDYVRVCFPDSKFETAPKSYQEHVSQFYEGLLERKYASMSLPERSVYGRTDKHSRLEECISELSGDVLLLLESGARMSAEDADRIPNVLSEFTRSAKLFLVQGRGYHAFIRTKLLLKYGFPYSGKVKAGCATFGLNWKRVGYIAIDTRQSGDYRW